MKQLLSKWLNKFGLKSGGFARAVALISGGTVLSQLIVIAASPVLTRVYSPQEFGILAVFVSIVVTLVGVCSLRYESTIPLPEKDEDASYLVVISGGFALLSSLATALVLWFWGEAILTRVRGTELIRYAWMIPLSLLAAGIYQTLSFWGIRKQAFKTLSQTKLTQSIAMVATQTGAGLAGIGYSGLLAGDTLGRSMGCIPLARSLVLPKSLFSTASIRRMFQLAVRYGKFPLIGTWNVLLNTLSIQLPFLLLNIYFSEAVTGAYALAYRVLGLPSQVVGQAVGQVLFAKVSARKNDPEFMRSAAEKITIGLFGVGLPFYLIIAIGGRDIFFHVFGSQWKEAGYFSQILSLWFFVWLVSSPLSNLGTIKEKQGIIFAFSFLIFGLRIGSIWAGAKMNSGSAAIWFLALSGFLISVTAIEGFSRVGGTSLKRMVRPIGKIAGIAALTVIPLNFIYLTSWLFVLKAVVSAISVGLYFLLALKWKVIDLKAMKKG
ncbi:MAG: lipopolysaccharide biosynthesis protein [Verrucomicrobiales bacterium]